MNTKQSCEVYPRMVKCDEDALHIYYYIFGAYKSVELLSKIAYWMTYLPEGFGKTYRAVPLNKNSERVAKWLSDNPPFFYRVSEVKKEAAALKVLSFMITRCSTLFGKAISLGEAVDWKLSEELADTSLKQLVGAFKFDTILCYVHKVFETIVGKDFLDEFLERAKHVETVDGQFDLLADMSNGCEKQNIVVMFLNFRIFLEATFYYFRP